MTEAQSKPAPLVAIVTPVYNGAATLAETMEGVQAQTYPNVVHVLLDNASTDATAQIIASYKDRKVPLIVGKNPTVLPMDDNWNASLKLIPADAAYFYVLCADDVLYPDAVARMVALAESDPAIVAVGSAAMYNEQAADFGWPADRQVFAGDEAVRRCFTSSGNIDPRLTLLRTEALKSADPFFDVNVGHMTDIDAVMRLLAHGKFGFVHERLAMLREHTGSITATATRPLRIQFYDWLVILRRYGPKAFGEAAYRAMERRYRRFYFRRLLRWRYVDANKRAFDHHMQLLAKMNSRPTLWDFADSVVDLGLKRLGLRPGWYDYPY